MADRNLADEFNDPANRKFRRMWEKEADLANDFEMGMDWYKSWSDKRDGFIQANDAPRAESCQGLVDFWDRWLVKAAGRLARHKENMDGAKDGLAAEFNQKNLTILQPLYDALSKLDDAQIKSGKEIYGALLPLMEEKQQPAPEAPKPGPFDKGNPFKKGPAA